MLIPNPNKVSFKRIYSAAHLSKKLIFIEQVKKKTNLQIQSIQYQLCQLQYPYRKYGIFHS